VTSRSKKVGWKWFNVPEGQTGCVARSKGSAKLCALMSNVLFNVFGDRDLVRTYAVFDTFRAYASPQHFSYKTVGKYYDGYPEYIRRVCCAFMESPAEFTILDNALYFFRDKAIDVLIDQLHPAEIVTMCGLAQALDADPRLRQTSSFGTLPRKYTITTKSRRGFCLMFLRYVLYMIYEYYAQTAWYPDTEGRPPSAVRERPITPKQYRYIYTLLTKTAMAIEDTEHTCNVDLAQSLAQLDQLREMAKADWKTYIGWEKRERFSDDDDDDADAVFEDVIRDDFGIDMRTGTVI